MDKFKEALDVAFKIVMLLCIIIALINTVETRRNVSDVAGELSSYKTFISQPVGNNEFEIEEESVIE